MAMRVVFLLVFIVELAASGCGVTHAAPPVRSEASADRTPQYLVVTTPCTDNCPQCDPAFTTCSTCDPDLDPTCVFEIVSIGGGGGASGGSTPQAQWHLVGESACITQGGRYSDWWTPLTTEFDCQHVTDPGVYIVLLGDTDTACFVTVVLPPRAVGPILVSISGNSLTPSGSTLRGGVRSDGARCYWTPAS